MAAITLTFSSINTSVQIGDTAYYTNPQTNQGQSGFDVGGDMVTIGIITAITPTTIVCNIDDTTVVPTVSSFIFFSKDNIVNLTSLLGYFGSVQFSNNSTVKAELFATACEIFESSK